MSVLSNPEATPNRMRAVYEWLLKSPNHEEEEERLKHLIIPSYHNDTENERGSDRRSMFVGKVLNEMASAGIVDRMENKVRLSPETLQVMRDKSDDFPVVFSSLLFSNARNDDFLHALAFIFCLNPLQAPSSWHSMEDLVKRANCQDVTGLKNDLNYGNFVHWSAYLGLSWEYLTFVPDPHRYIGSFLKYEFKKGEMLLTAFLSQLTAKFPVIDGGEFNSAIRSRLGIPLEPHRLSGCLSLVLSQLANIRAIELSKKSDTTSVFLTNEFGNQSFSHILIK